jgi:5'-deoxynucleotidase YfbR-like HD superfamily hydrolase
LFKLKPTSMSEETEEKVVQEKLTPEQLEANRKKAIKYYKDQIEVIKQQEEYERLLAEIETHRARRTEMVIRQAQMLNPPESPETDGEKKPRPLKKVD